MTFRSTHRGPYHLHISHPTWRRNEAAQQTSGAGSLLIYGHTRGVSPQASFATSTPSAREDSRRFSGRLPIHAVLHSAARQGRTQNGRTGEVERRTGCDLADADSSANAANPRTTYAAKHHKQHPHFSFKARIALVSPSVSTSALRSPKISFSRALKNSARQLPNPFDTSAAANGEGLQMRRSARGGRSSRQRIGSQLSATPMSWKPISSLADVPAKLFRSFCFFYLIDS